MKIKCYNIHNVVKFKIIDRHNNVKNFLSHLDKAYSYFEVKNVKKPDFVVNIGPFKENNKNAHFLDERYYVKKNYLFCKDSYKKAKWKLQINGFEKEMMNVDVDVNIFGQMFIPGYIVDPLIRLKMSEKRKHMIHAACVSKDDSGYIFAARSGVGKTIISLFFVEKGFNFLGDNWIILNNSKTLNYPCPLNVFTYNINEFIAEKLSYSTKIWLELKGLLFKLTGGYAKIFTPVEVQKIIPDSIVKKSRNKTLFFLSKGKRVDIRTNNKKDDIISQLVTSSMFEMFPFFIYMLEYSYSFPESKISLFWENMKRDIKEYLKKVKFYEISVPERITTSDLNKIYDFVVSLYGRNN